MYEPVSMISSIDSITNDIFAIEQPDVLSSIQPPSVDESMSSPSKPPGISEYAASKLAQMRQAIESK